MTPTPNADQRPFTVMMAFRRTAQRMVEELARRLEADGYGTVQHAYHALFENIDPEGTRLTELAARADMTHQSMGELVAALERRGWVQRRRDPSDGRARLVCLTPEGTRITRRGLHHINEIEAEWQERWREAGYDGNLRDVLEQALNDTERA
jgi:DNA-binding MarR family transcriptional regulator